MCRHLQWIVLLVVATHTKRMQWLLRLLSCQHSSLSAVPDGTESASTRCPFDMGTTPLNDWLRGDRERLPPTPLQLKPLINQSYLKEPIHPPWRDAHRWEKDKLHIFTLIYLFYNLPFSTAAFFPQLQQAAVTITTQLEHKNNCIWLTKNVYFLCDVNIV